MLELAQAQESYNAALEKLADGKYELALERIAELAGQAMETLGGTTTGTQNIAKTVTETVPKVVKEVAEKSPSIVADPTRGQQRIAAMGGMGVFGEPSMTVNFNKPVSDPNEVVNALKTYTRTNGPLNRVIEIQ